jgi:hypothetical protein
MQNSTLKLDESNQRIYGRLAETFISGNAKVPCHMREPTADTLLVAELAVNVPDR